MESAIPDDLLRERSRDPRVRADYSPPYPSFVARYPAKVRQVAMAYFGVQYDTAGASAAEAALSEISAAFAGEDGPGHWDRARYVDGAGLVNVVSVGYWTDLDRFDRWFPAVRAAWTGRAASEPGLGLFIEALRPEIESFETLFSSLGRPEGVAVIAREMSGEVQEHAYWGGMRDRVPLSQTSDMAPAGEARAEREGQLVRVAGLENLCLIRSGQDWTDTEDAERKLYLADVEPTLRKGMDFLRDDGVSIGCFVNRYMAQVDANGREIEKSYGMSWWKSLAALEGWAESHPTHVEIFGAAMRYLRTMGPAAKLRLYHEVSIVKSSEQFFEYLNCHAKTGLLAALNQ